MKKTNRFNHRVLRVSVFIIVVFHVNTFSQRITSFVILDSADAGLVSYPATGQSVCYSKTEADGFYDIYTINLDGSNKYCRTCNSFLTRNNAHPEWHPGMNYIIFEGEKVNNTFLSHPGFGWNYDLWALRLSDSTLYNIRDPLAANPGYSLTGVLHPHFSHDGTKLAWSELRGSLINWQNYAIMIADFIDSPAPHLSNVTVLYDPVYGLAETQGFSFNDDKLLFAGNNDSGQSSATLDLFYLQLNADFTLQNPVPFPVSKSDTEWAEAAKFMPGDQKIIFSTTKTFPVYPDSTPVFEWRKSEYWSVNTDGTNPVRLSYFMNPDSIGYMASKTDAADFDISPAGDELIATINANNTLYVVGIGMDNSAAEAGTKYMTGDDFSIYPNPAVDKIAVDINLKDINNGKIQIYNAMYMLLKEIELTKATQVNISDLPPGLYFILLKGNSNQTKKFIKI